MSSVPKNHQRFVFQAMTLTLKPDSLAPLLRRAFMNRRLIGADGIRGLACLIVLIMHVIVSFYPESFRYLAGCGKIGVWLFFVLSAFLLTNKLKIDGFNLSSLINYGVGRLFRIFPLYVVAVIAYRLLGHGGIDTWGDAFGAITLSEGYVHLWTIPVEFKFYFALPFIAYLFVLVRERLGSVGVLCVTPGLILLHQIVFPYWETPQNSLETSWYLPSFILGCAAAVVYNDFRHIVTGVSASITGLCVIVAMIFSSPVARNYLFGSPMTDELMNKFVYLSLGWVVFMLFNLECKGVFGAILSSRIMVSLGLWSYSIYLFHWLVYSQLASGNTHSFEWMVVALFSAILIGGFIYRYIEVPIESFRHRLKVSPQVDIAKA